jgi:hypothetical protein
MLKDTRADVGVRTSSEDGETSSVAEEVRLTTASRPSPVHIALQETAEHKADRADKEKVDSSMAGI